MSLKRSKARTLRAVVRKAPRRRLKAAFAAIRSHSDHDLFATILPAKPRKRRAKDPLVRDVEAALKPVMGPASEKAEMLVEHLSKKHRRRFDFQPAGLTDSVRRLRATLSDDDIRDGARGLVEGLAQLYGDREAVV